MMCQDNANHPKCQVLRHTCCRSPNTGRRHTCLAGQWLYAVKETVGPWAATGLHVQVVTPASLPAAAGCRVAACLWGRAAAATLPRQGRPGWLGCAGGSRVLPWDRRLNLEPEPLRAEAPYYGGLLRGKEQLGEVSTTYPSPLLHHVEAPESGTCAGTVASPSQHRPAVLHCAGVACHQWPHSCPWSQVGLLEPACLGPVHQGAGT